MRHLLVLAATSDTDDLATLERAAASMGVDLRGLSVAEDAGLMTLGPGQVQFRHPLARAAIYSAAPRSNAEGRTSRSPVPFRIATPTAGRGTSPQQLSVDEAASSALAQAGTRAHERSAYGVADAAFERAARLAGRTPRPVTRVGGRFRVARGFADRAIALLSEARELVIEPERLIEIEQLRGHIAVHRGPVMEGHAILVAAAELRRDQPGTCRELARGSG